MVNFFHHLAIFSNHPQELIKFYTEMLGFETGDKKSIPESVIKKIFAISSSCSLTKLKLDNFMLEIISPENQNLKQKSNDILGYNHWCLVVKDKKAFVEKLKKKGVTTIEVEKDGHFIFFISDPEGNLIEIYET